MKIRSCAALLIALLTLSLLTGCSVRKVEHKLEKAEEAVEHRLEAAEDAVEHRIREAAPGPAPAAPEAPDRLTPEEVQAIALEHAGLTAGEVSFLRADPEFDDRVPHYDVDFQEGRWEYEYEIHAETGEVLSFERDD